MRRTAVLAIVFFVVAPWAALRAGEASPSAARPNIVIILADDFGVGDIQAHFPENKIPTTHLDRLVRQGRSFTDAHSSSAVCSPTRYGLLTGRYNWRTRLQEWVIAAYEPPLIAADRPTLPGFLRRHGYHTACIGKWHLGWEWPGPQPSRMTEKHNGQAGLVSHSNFGEFAYRDGPWKLAWRLSKPNLEQSRGQPTVPELYHLGSDVAEQTDLAAKHPDRVQRMTRDLKTLIDRGTSRPGQQAANDTLVRFDTTQEKRWAPARDR